jgi:hypothetical protein
MRPGKHVVLVLALCACGKKDDKQAPATVGSAAGSAVATATPADAPTVATDAPEDPRCVDACLILSDVAFAGAPAKRKEVCGSSYWPYGDSDCSVFQYQINCIYAARGYVFKKPDWKDRFVNKPWYEARPDFKESDLGAVATANIKVLKALHKTCLAEEAHSKRPVSAEDRKAAVAAWNNILRDKSSGSLDREMHVDEEQTKFSYVTLDSEDPGHRGIQLEGAYHAVGPGSWDSGFVTVVVLDKDGKPVIEEDEQQPP